MAAEVAAAPSMAVAPALTPTRPKEFMVDLSLEKSQPWSCSVARRSQKTRSHSCLVVPTLGPVVALGQRLARALAEALEDRGHVAQVEGVVRLRRRRQELLQLLQRHTPQNDELQDSLSSIRRGSAVPGGRRSPGPQPPSQRKADTTERPHHRPQTSAQRASKTFGV